jgi:hypothetical protein
MGIWRKYRVISMKYVKSTIIIITISLLLILFSGLLFISIKKHNTNIINQIFSKCIEFESQKSRQICLDEFSSQLIFEDFDLEKYKSKKKKCDFTITDLQIYRGDYTKTTHYTIFEGIIKNNSVNTETLKAMIATIYNNNGVELGSGYTGISKDIAPGRSVKFKIHTDADTLEIDTENDIYPWFTTCD